MQVKLALFSLALVAPLASAHYTFSGLVVNDEMVGGEWEYIREHQRGYMPTFREEAATSDDFRCNQGASSGANTGVYTVAPGDTVALRQAFGAGGMEHPGPTQIYLSQAPGSVKEYDGSGEWIKVYQSLVCKQGATSADFQTEAWCMWGEETIGFTVPETIPDGEYLLRGEHIALHGAHDGRAEFYYACAQIKVEGSSAQGLPEGPTTLIPGVYSVEDEAINFSVWGQSTSYDFIPGIEVAPGGQIRGSANGSTSDIVVVDAPGESSGDEGSSENDDESSPLPPATPTPDFTTIVGSAPTAAPTAPVAENPAKPPHDDVIEEGDSCPLRKRHHKRSHHKRRHSRQLS